MGSTPAHIKPKTEPAYFALKSYTARRNIVKVLFFKEFFGLFILIQLSVLGLVPARKSVYYRVHNFCLKKLVLTRFLINKILHILAFLVSVNRTVARNDRKPLRCGKAFYIALGHIQKRTDNIYIAA